jgi:hypothetical protein
MHIHRIASDAMVDLGYSSKLNAEWEFLVMLRDEGRRAAEAFLSTHGDDLGKCSSFDLDALLVGDMSIDLLGIFFASAVRVPPPRAFVHAQELRDQGGKFLGFPQIYGMGSTPALRANSDRCAVCASPVR